MKKVGILGFILWMFALTAVVHQAVGQQMRIDTDEIESLIDEWNFANNSRNVHSFQSVYADDLLFYTEQVTESKAITLKRQLFNRKPYFRQRITTEIKYTPYSSGVVKCEFTKEVFEKTHWKKYPSYLLVSYKNNHYSIVGESDYPTDRALKYKQEIGQAMTIEKPKRAAPQAIDSVGLDSVLAERMPSLAKTDTTAVSAIDTVDHGAGFAVFDTMLSDLSSLGMVIIPKGYILALVGILAIGGVMIFIADSVQSRRRRRRLATSPAQPRRDEAEHVVQDFKMQSAFENFVITLFDPLYFKCFRAKAEHVYAGKTMQAESGPDLIFDFNQKETRGRFGITTQYYRHTPKNEVQLVSYDRQQYIRHFESEQEMDVYFVLGFGGRPDDPRELFFVPAKEVDSEYITQADLKRYSKSGMFYFNRKTGRIQ
jgi:hypothetical protein